MKTKPILKRVFLFALAIPAVLGLALGQEDIREKAAAAIRLGDHEAAVRLCLEGLRQNHADYELNFLLGRAYAFSKRYDDALRVFGDLALAHPENTDVLLFGARVNAWKHDYKAAEEGFKEVLRLNPGNSEALTGLAEVASWQSRYTKALAFYALVRESDPANANIYFRIGRVYLWQGNRAQAEANFGAALQIDPQNEEYKRELQKTKPRQQEKFELRYEHQTDNFSDERSRYLDQNLALQTRLLKNAGPLVLKYNHTERAGQGDHRYGLEFYPHLWKKAYGYIDFSYSPRGFYYPETAFLFEAYQAVLSSAEISLGFRRMNFSSERVSQYLGSLGYYFGNFYAYWRWYSSNGETGDRFAWLANLRRYFSADSFVFIGYGRGVRTEDVITLEDFRANQSWVFLAGFNWYFLKQIKLQAYYSLGDEGASRRNTLFISTGYRW